MEESFDYLFEFIVQVSSIDCFMLFPRYLGSIILHLHVWYSLISFSINFMHARTHQAQKAFHNLPNPAFDKQDIKTTHQL